MNYETFQEISMGLNHAEVDTELKDLFYIDTDRGYNEGGIITFSLAEAKWLQVQLGNFIGEAEKVDIRRKQPMTQKKNKFANLTEQDWIQTNEASTQNRGVSALTYEDIYGKKTKPHYSYNVQYTNLEGETVMASRNGILFDNEVNVHEFITYNGLLLRVTAVKSLLLEAVEQDTVIQVGRDWTRDDIPEEDR